MDAPIRKITRPSVARVCVLVDLLKDMPNRIWLGMGKFGCWQRIIYGRRRWLIKKGILVAAKPVFLNLVKNETFTGPIGAHRTELVEWDLCSIWFISVLFSFGMLHHIPVLTLVRFFARRLAHSFFYPLHQTWGHYSEKEKTKLNKQARLAHQWFLFIRRFLIWLFSWIRRRRSSSCLPLLSTGLRADPSFYLGIPVS